jgi:general secretion pathway protein J
MTRRTRHATGFTLLEILLALVLLAFVMAGVWGALAGATRITHSADAMMARSESVRTLQQFLRRYLGAAQTQPWVTDNASPARMFEGDDDSMQYVAPLPMQSGHAGLYLQTIKLVKAKDGSYALTLDYTPYTDDAPPSGSPHSRVLLSGLHGGKFRYLAVSKFDQPATWRDDWRAATGLPLAVRIHLDPAWPVRVAFPDMVIVLQAGTGFDPQGAGGLR